MTKKTLTLLEAEDIFNILKSLPLRYQIIEACLIVEEYIEGTIELYLPDFKWKDIDLTLDQKLTLFEHFLSDENKSFSILPRMLQRMRNKVAHNRSYTINEDSLKSFYKELSKKEKDSVDAATARTFKKMGKANTYFSQLTPQDQFLLLIVWFTIGLRTEIKRGPFTITRTAE